jgi:hypothetical protein
VPNDTKDHEKESQAAFNPDDVILDDRKKEQDEFDAAFESINNPDLKDDTKSADDGQVEDDSSDDEDQDTKTDEEEQEAGSAPDDDQGTPADAEDSTDWKTKYQETLALLEKEEQKTRTWDGRIRAANKRAKIAEELVETQKKTIEDLKVKLEDQSGSYSDSGDDDEDVLDEFPELKDRFNKAVEEEIKRRGLKKADPADESADDDTDTGDDQELHDAAKDRIATLAKVHPDYKELVESGEVVKWINSKPEYIRGTLVDVWQNPTLPVSHLISLFDNYKEETAGTTRTTVAGGNKPKPKDKQSKKEALKEVPSSGATIDTSRKPNHLKSFDDGAKEAGLV